MTSDPRPSQERMDALAAGARVEALFRDGSMLVRVGGDAVECRATATVGRLADEEDGLAAPLPWRDAACRESAVRAVASDRTLEMGRRRRVAAHAAGLPVLNFPREGLEIGVRFVDPPDWSLAERLGGDFWEGDAPAPWLCSTTARVEGGAVMDCSSARFDSADQREVAVRRVAGDARLHPEERRGLAERIAKTPFKILENF